MARRTRVALALVLLVATAAHVAARPAAEPREARRIVSLNPSLTAMLVALGAADRLVGVDDWSARQQPDVAELPTVGGLYSPSLEAVVGLAPDLVVAVPSAEQRGFRARLEEVGVPLLELDPLRFDEVLATIETLGARVGKEDEARARVEAIRRTRRRVEAWAADRPRRRGVLVLQRDPLFLAGGGTFVDEMLAAVGVDNLAAQWEEPWPRASREWLLAAAPQVLLDTGERPAAYWARWPSLPAVREGRVVKLEEGVVTLPGPWLDRALLTLAEAVHGPAAAALADAPE